MITSLGPFSIFGSWSELEDSLVSWVNPDSIGGLPNGTSTVVTLPATGSSKILRSPVTDISGSVRSWTEGSLVGVKLALVDAYKYQSGGPATTPVGYWTGFVFGPKGERSGYAEIESPERSSNNGTSLELGGSSDLIRILDPISQVDFSEFSIGAQVRSSLFGTTEFRVDAMRYWLYFQSPGSQLIRIRRRLVAEALLEAFPGITYSDEPQLGQPSAAVASAAETPSLPVLCNEISSRTSIDKLHGRDLVLSHDERLFELRLSFKKEILLEKFEERLMASPPIISRDETAGLKQVTLLYRGKQVLQHPVQQQASTGTHAVLTFEALEGRG